MSNTLTINTALVNDHWEITATMQAGTLPAEIFVSLNTATNTLGQYVGVCDLDEISRLQVFSGTPIPIFGNKYVRTSSVTIIATLDTITSTITTAIVNSVNLLSTAYKAKANSIQVFTIL